MVTEFKGPVAVTLLQHIKDAHSGSQVAFAQHCGVKPPQVTQWIAKGFIVVDGKLYSPRRDIY